FPLGSTTVTYSAVDAAGNTAECSFVVTVVDRSAPVIDCPDDLTVSADAGQCAAVVDWDLPNTTDCGTVTLTVSQAPMSTFAVGTTTVTYTATDAAGNSSNCSFDVTVEDNENPIFANCPPSDVNIGATNNCEAIVTWTPVTATDNCVLLPLVSTHEPGDTFPVGETTVRIVALDVNGNTTECEFVVNVPDNSAPVFSDCPDDVTLSVDAGTCEAVHSWTPPTVTDDCSNIIPVASNDPGDAFPLGQTVVTYTATDAAGNSNVCSFSVTVEDDENPTIDCPADLVLRIDGEVISDPSNVLVAASTAAGCTGLIVEFGEPTGMDNCDGSLTATQIAGPDNGGSFALGENVVTFEVEDAAGNFVDCSFSITVEDLPAVAINASPDAAGCTNSTVQLTPTIIAGASYTWTTPGGDNVNQTTLDITIGSATTGTYRVVCTTSAGCTSEGSIVIEALPEALVSIQTNAPLCDGDLELDGIVETGSAPISSWEWSGPCDFTASGQSVSIPDLTDACSGIYTLTATTDEGCTMVVNTAVDIVQVAAPVIEDDCSQVLCLGESCFLLGTDYVPSPDEYVWSASSLDAGLPEDTNENEIMVTPLAAGSYTYRYSVIIDGCQSAEDSITIRVAGAPDAEGDSLRVNFETTLENFDILENDEFDPELQGVITIESQPTRGILTSNTDGTFNYEPSSGFIGTDFFTYRLCHGCDEFQCDVATVRIEVEFDGPCVVPTMITPNDDGANDRLQILCLESGLFPNNELIIFNQWGDRVFEAAPYQNDWDGTLRGEEGRDLPDGTYFFLFKRDQESQAVKGYLTIFR
ncbi:MAG: HYR domain-containing protein, partial [Bacteroidota bacterium]